MGFVYRFFVCQTLKTFTVVRNRWYEPVVILGVSRVARVEALVRLRGAARGRHARPYRWRRTYA